VILGRGEVGDHQARWDGYLVEPGSAVLRNKVGATTVEQLQAAENDLLEHRLAELRERPGLVARTYDLAHLKALHGQLFQDVYEWAGELRTVGLAKGEGEDTA
jgi:cell filamentation protein